MNRDNQDNRHQSHRHYRSASSGLSLALAAAGASSCMDGAARRGRPARCVRFKQGACCNRRDRARTGVRDFWTFTRPPVISRPRCATTIDGRSGAILRTAASSPPRALEVNVGAPKPFGLALSPDGQTLATINSGAVALLGHADPQLRAAPARPSRRVDAQRELHGRACSRPTARASTPSGGENGNIWVGDTATGQIIGSVNLNGAAHPLDRPLDVRDRRSRAAFQGRVPRQHGAVERRPLPLRRRSGKLPGARRSTRPRSRPAPTPHGQRRRARQLRGGRRPRQGRPLPVRHQPARRRSHAAGDATSACSSTRTCGRPCPTGEPQRGLPALHPRRRLPRRDRDAQDDHRSRRSTRSTISGLPTSLRDPEGIRCGYVPADVSYTIPALGSPNAPRIVVGVRDGRQPPGDAVAARRSSRPGLAVGENEDGIAAYGGSHPNAVVDRRQPHLRVERQQRQHPDPRYAENGHKVGDISLAVLPGTDRILKGVQPVSIALSPDRRFLYVAEAGLNAVGVVSLQGQPRVVGHIPTGWWPSSVQGERATAARCSWPAPRGAAPGRTSAEPGAEAQRDGDGQRHRTSPATASSPPDTSRSCATTASTAMTTATTTIVMATGTAMATTATTTITDSPTRSRTWRAWPAGRSSTSSSSTRKTPPTT